VIGEQILRDHAVASGQCRVVALRYFNPTGAHESGLLGEDPIGHHTHLVPIITEVARGKRPVLKVFGADYPTRDGTCVRDYIHVCDLARAHVLALDYLAQGRNEHPFEAINIGSGTGQTVLEMVDAYQKATGLSIPYELAPRRPGDAGAVYADIRLANATLGWEPKFSLSDMLLSTYQWEKSLS
jgi:UDP-glucose 4-epimerase